MTDKKYHMRRKEREIVDSTEIHAILSSAKFMTIAMSSGDRPYLVTVNHVFDPEAGAIYFHCARSGKKVDFLAANPRVCCEVLEDKGYVEGECDYDYRSVHINGTASMVGDIDEKKRALVMMIDKLDRNPEDARQKFINQSALESVTVFKIRVESMTGKMRVP